MLKRVLPLLAEKAVRGETLTPMQREVLADQLMLLRRRQLRAAAHPNRRRLLQRMQATTKVRR